MAGALLQCDCWFTEQLGDNIAECACVSAWVRVCTAIAFPSLPGPQGRAASCTLSEEPCHLASLGTHKLETSLLRSRTKETREAKLTGKHLLRQSRPKDIRRTMEVLQEMAGLIQCTEILGRGMYSCYNETFKLKFLLSLSLKRPVRCLFIRVTSNLIFNYLIII